MDKLYSDELIGALIPITEIDILITMMLIKDAFVCKILP